MPSTHIADVTNLAEHMTLRRVTEASCSAAIDREAASKAASQRKKRSKAEYQLSFKLEISTGTVRTYLRVDAKASAISAHTEQIGFWNVNEQLSVPAGVFSDFISTFVIPTLLPYARAGLSRITAGMDFRLPTMPIVRQDSITRFVPESLFEGEDIVDVPASKQPEAPADDAN